MSPATYGTVVPISKTNEGGGAWSNERSISLYGSDNEVMAIFQQAVGQILFPAPAAGAPTREWGRTLRLYVDQLLITRGADPVRAAIVGFVPPAAGPGQPFFVPPPPPLYKDRIQTTF